MSDARSIKIAVTALGGQGGGVVADWIVKLGERCGYIAQATSVPGVAQRTGATVYYVELFPAHAAKEKGKSPVLALMPVPGDVDIVIAAELMEAGRAIMRGFVTERTVLIASSHRDYAIAEKIAMSDGRESGDKVITAAEKAAGQFIHADMATAAMSAGAVISAVLFGALAGSGVLPMAREDFEQTIRDTGRAVENNLCGFAEGFRIAAATKSESPQSITPVETAQPSRTVAPLIERLKREFPPATHYILYEGLKRLVDFQDICYAELYLDRLAEILATDRAAGGDAREWRLTEKAGKHLALWMTYDDAIRVADLKTRASRFQRFRDDVRADEGQIVNVSEYLHPRVEEVCDILPVGIGRGILKSDALRKLLRALLGEGRRVSTTKMRGFLPLYFLASLRFMRRVSYRYGVEQQRIIHWLSLVKSEAPQNYALACELAGSQRLIKGYGDTHERGLANFNRIMEKLDQIKKEEDAGDALAGLVDAAMKDEDGVALNAALVRLDQKPSAAA